MDDKQEATVKLGAVHFDRRTQALTDHQGRKVALRPQSLSVLAALIARNGKLADREELIAEIWGSVNVTDDSLIQCIADIRRVIGEDGRNIVQTVPKKGYKLVVPQPVSPATSVSPGRRHLAFGIAVLVIAMALVSAWGLLGSSKSGKAGAAIAVLPFDNIGGDNSQAYFTDGFTKAITTNISRFEDLFVVSSFSAFKYRNSKKPPAEIARELGVRYLLTGDVQPGQDELIINAQLTDVSDGKSLWAERYDAPRADIFEMQNKLSAKIAGTLVQRVESAMFRQARSANFTDLNAYELVLRAANAKVEKTALIESLGLIEQAIKLDPSSAGVHAQLANSYLLLWRHSLTDDPDEMLRRARSAATRAIELDNNSYRSHQVLSLIYLYADKDHAQALASITKALNINPNEADLMIRMGTLLGFMNRDVEAIEWIEQAMLQNPLHPAWYEWNAGFVYAVAGKNERAIIESKKALAVYKTSASIRRVLIAAHGELGQWTEAKRYALEIIERDPQFTLSTHMRNSPFQDLAEREHIWNLFRQAGLPD
ncbi:MAG: hypothetical protein GY948_12790 [Alphaproteobacteria bacterium]|nr:hypothetical protein [Alphaproteobacteria bacterium]